MVCDVLLDERDARTTHILEVVKNVGKSNDVYLFAPKSKNVKEMENIVSIPSIIPTSTLKYTFYKVYQAFSFLCLLLYQLFLFFYLIYYYLKLSPELLYVRYSTLTFSPPIISKLFCIPLVIEVNGLPTDEIKLTNKSRIHMGIAKLSSNLNYKHAKKIVTVTLGIKNAIEKEYNIESKNIIVIPNGANINLFRKSIKPKLELNLNQNNNYICFVGNLVPWQGVEYAIQAAPLILTAYPDARFLIVGEGLMKEELINLAEKTGVLDKFIFTGAVPYEEVPKYINVSDVCIVPKRPLKSGFSPLKLYEYMACGKSVVASRISGFEILEEQNAGFLVEPENPEELANAVIKLLKDEKLREEMGRNGREYVVKNHSWESVARRVAEVCESAIK
jgi:glycosyltransferase involved in cell wall biosynthesis